MKGQKMGKSYKRDDYDDEYEFEINKQNSKKLKMIKKKDKFVEENDDEFNQFVEKNKKYSTSYFKEF